MTRDAGAAMSEGQWRRVKALFASALERGPRDRAAFVDRAADGDETVRAEVMSLLAASAQDSFPGAHAAVSRAAAEVLGLVPDAAAAGVARPADASELQARLAVALDGRYAIERELGRGGMATVFLARDVRHGRSIALKVMHPELAAVVGMDRFLREIETVARLSHPHVLPLFDSGEAAGLPYYVMPYVAGGSLRQRIVRERHLPVDEAVRIVCGIARALEHAHGVGVLHRDVKPENILLAEERPLLADFGISRTETAAGASLTRTGVVVGTPAYMAPEQASADADVDGRADLYALACVLYELLTGQPPYGGPTVQSVILQHMGAAVPSPRVLRPNMPPALAEAVRRALAKRPADRHATGEAFARAIERASASGPPSRGWRRAWASRRARLALVAGAGILGAGGATLWSLTASDPDTLTMYDVYRTRRPGSARRLAETSPRFQAAPPPGTNVAAGMPSFQSSTEDSHDPEAITKAFRANDGNLCAFFSCGGTQHTAFEMNAWWYVDLGQTTPIRGIRIYNIRTVGPTGRLFPSTVSVHADGQSSFTTFGAPSVWSGQLATQPNPDPLVYDLTPPPGTQGRYVKVQLNGMNWLHMAEVEVYR